MRHLNLESPKVLVGLGLGLREPPIWLFAVAVASLVAVVVAMSWSFWFIFDAAGRRKWFALIPGFNIVELTEVSRTSLWVLVPVFLLPPPLSLVPLMFVCFHVGRRFQQTTRFCFGAALLPFVFLPLLAHRVRRTEAAVIQDEALPPIELTGLVPRIRPPLPADLVAAAYVGGAEVAQVPAARQGVVSEGSGRLTIGRHTEMEIVVHDRPPVTYRLDKALDPGTTVELSMFVGPGGAAVECSARSSWTGQFVKFQPVLLASAPVSDADLNGHGLASRGLDLTDELLSNMILAICSGCGQSFAIDVEPLPQINGRRSIPLFCATGTHTLIPSHPVGASSSAAVAEQLPSCEACGTRFSNAHPFRCRDCSTPFLDLGAHPEDVQFETHAPVHRGETPQTIDLHATGWRQASDGNWYPPTMLK